MFLYHLFSGCCTSLSLRPFDNDPLIDQTAIKCLDKLKKTSVPDFIVLHLQFWHTWSNLEIAPFITTHPQISQSIKEQVTRSVTWMFYWAGFDIDDVQAPSVFKDRALISDKKFWDYTNKACLWDDRMWLGVAYVSIYQEFRVPKYLEAAQKLLDFIHQTNGDPLKDSAQKPYKGILWQYGGDYYNSVTQGLYMVFLSRLYSITKQQKLLARLKKQYQLFFKTPQKYINSNGNGIIPDGPDDGGYWSYNQAMPMEALAYLTQFDPSNAEEYMTQLIKLTNSTIKWFKRTDSEKYIFRENEHVGENNKNTYSIFRSYLFRHIILTKRVLSNNKSGLLQRWIKECPLLRIFCLDNFQAMCKYQDLDPGYEWQDDTSTVNFYNVYNQFYVLYAGMELFSIREMVVVGTELICNNILEVQLPNNVNSLKLTKLKIQGDKYVHGDTYILRIGSTNLQSLLGENLCNSKNNRNIMTLTVVYNDGRQVHHTLVHLEFKFSKFAIIPDCTGEQIINECGVRIHAQGHSASYVTRSTNQQIRLSHNSGIFMEPTNLKLAIV